MSELLPCPCCNDPAELDSQQRYYSRMGHAEKQVAVYCTGCSLCLTFCYADFPDHDVDQLVALATEYWNRRPQPSRTAGDEELMARVDDWLERMDNAKTFTTEEANLIRDLRTALSRSHVTVPEAISYDKPLDTFNGGYRAGWNACRATMIHGAAPKPSPTTHEPKPAEPELDGDYKAMLAS